MNQITTASAYLPIGHSILSKMGLGAGAVTNSACWQWPHKHGDRYETFAMMLPFKVSWQAVLCLDPWCRFTRHMISARLCAGFFTLKIPKSVR
jgi:hypothetical protein